MCLGWFKRLLGLGLLFRARGSHRPGRLPTRWQPTAFSIAPTSLARCSGRAASRFAANAVRACFAPLKLILRGSTLLSLAATAMTVRSKGNRPLFPAETGEKVQEAILVPASAQPLTPEAVLGGSVLLQHRQRQPAKHFEVRWTVIL